MQRGEHAGRDRRTSYDLSPGITELEPRTIKVGSLDLYRDPATLVHYGKPSLALAS
jgi:hypothetical protein